MGKNDESFADWIRTSDDEEVLLDKKEKKRKICNRGRQLEKSAQRQPGPMSSQRSATTTVVTADPCVFQNICSRISLKMRSFLSIQLFLVVSFVLLLNIHESVAPEGADEEVDGGSDVRPNDDSGGFNADVDGDHSGIRVRARKKDGAPKQEKPHHAGDTVASTKRREATAAEKAAKAQPAKTPKVTPIDKHSHLLTETASGKAAGRRGPGDK
ncbi:hypothetical protein DdX_13812 [Ditylenchus destructor]|uniref:Uncharacterized protein n=1 Tax=Ditylenchus destructor TaxID=166010 RepID=A0AAD4MY23_9BILA|nr:hypothetical protein DdX_13812 [Ditylenchus destructor]